MTERNNEHVDEAGVADHTATPAPEAADPEHIDTGTPGTSEPNDAADPESPAAALARERLEDLQRLQAEFFNYKRRVERDRDLGRVRTIHEVLMTLLPVLDDIHAAREAGDLTSGPFAAIAEKLEAALAKYGLQRYGESGEIFDPEWHEALMHVEAELPEGTEHPTIVQVLQPGYRSDDTVIRPARVSVADPD